MKASLLACHCAPANWFTNENRLSKEELARIRSLLRNQIAECQSEESTLTWQSVIVENSFDPARDIINLAREAEADLIVMKARPGVLSAFRFGSIVERVIELARCPVLLLPSRFLDAHDPRKEALEFRRVLFDYDFSEATDDLLRSARALAHGHHAELEVLSVLEPSGFPPRHTIAFSPTRLQTVVRSRLTEALSLNGDSSVSLPAAVAWGRHAETVLEYARDHRADLICTALAPPNFYVDKIYSTYLGRLLMSSRCPILVKQSLPLPKIRDLT